MGRRRGIGSLLNQIAREAAREARRQQMDARRAARDYERSSRAADKAARADYREARELEAEELNEELELATAELEKILQATLDVDDTITFESLRQRAQFPTFEAPSDLARAAPRPIEADFISAVGKPGFWAWIPAVARGHEARMAKARASYARDLNVWERNERTRLEALHSAQAKHEQDARAHAEMVARKNADLERFQKEYLGAVPDAVAAYHTMVLERSAYPESLGDMDASVKFNPDAGELAIDYELPDTSCIPPVAQYKFIKSKDVIDEKPRKATQIRALYQDVLAAICLRSIHEVLEADRPKHLRSVVFSGSASGVSPATGQQTEVCLVTVRASREVFDRLNLRRIDKLACLKELRGQISARPDELAGVDAVVPYGAGEGKLERLSDRPPAQNSRVRSP
jgi:restriction system protein